ncbi:UDP-N-acetylglucosamine transporter YEA4 [Termitomyces sp. T112]|nr:UDP-N-acetylglucosamine transporter YEA4 [Termitomyces sp. T112]
MVVRRHNASVQNNSPDDYTVSNGASAKFNGNDPSLDRGFSMTQAAPIIIDYYFALSLVMGGCCTNVWAYEQLLMLNPRIGSALTFSQMLFITLQSLPTFIEFQQGQFIPRLKPRHVPIHQWAFQVVVLLTGTLFNNWAFAYSVPLTLLIVFRSAGLAVSMLFGVVFLKKRYSTMQITSVITVTVGVVLATLSRPKATPTSSESTAQTSEDMQKYLIGVTMLATSLFLTAFLGMLQEKTYKKYGPCWKEGVFYTHFLSLPMFLLLIPDIKQGYTSLSKDPSSSAPLSFLILGLNLISQFICVSGVNRLSSQVSSVSTNLVLTARKALSLCISVWWFNNGWNAQLSIGAGMVFLGSALFSMASNVKAKKH